MPGDRHSPALLDDAALEASAVVANCAMNRQRQLAGVNSYTRELGFHPVDALTDRLADRPADAARSAPEGPGSGRVGWLDLCCGIGRALIHAAGLLRQRGLDERVDLVGVDLVDAFDPVPATPGLELICASLSTWEPDRTFDVITCVHGLHYIGDKLRLLTRAPGWLNPGGRFVADLDLASIRLADGRPAGRHLTTRLRAAGFSYDARRHRISRTGPARLELPYRYLGADDHAGPTYTGQPGVNSYYELADGCDAHAAAGG